MVIKSTGNHFWYKPCLSRFNFISVLVLKGVLGINENYLNIIRVLGCLYIGYLGFSILKEVIQAPHPEAIQTVSAQNGGFKKAFSGYFKP